MRRHSISHVFVEAIPEHLEEGVLYVSMNYATAIHRCACGCGQEVVTPLSPSDWRLTFDGESVTLYPSIGNWSFPCQSHYWIRDSRVKWDRSWSAREIEKVRTADREAHAKRFGEEGSGDGRLDIDPTPKSKSLWSKMTAWFR